MLWASLVVVPAMLPAQTPCEQLKSLKLADATITLTESAGLRRWVNSNGAIWLDYDRDGLLDLYVTAYFRDDIDLWHLTTTRIMHNSIAFATNGGKNLLFHNLGGGKFEEVGITAGVAFDQSGSARGAMGIDWAHFKNDVPAENDPKSVHVHVVAQQFKWIFHYPGADGKFGKTRPELIEAGTNPLGRDPDDPDGKDDFEKYTEFHVPAGVPVGVKLSSPLSPHGRIWQNSRTDNEDRD